MLSALQASFTTVTAVQAKRALLRGRAGLQLLGSVCEEFDPVLESVIEVEFSRLMRAAGVTCSVPQFEIVDAGRLVARCDFAVPERKLDFETDGFAFHHTRPQLAADRHRDRQLTRLGWRTVRYGTRRHPATPRGDGGRRVDADLGRDPRTSQLSRPGRVNRRLA